MRLRELYNLIIQKGLAKDPRTKKELRDEHKRIRREYGRLAPEDKKYFDKDCLKHPYTDTRILYGAGKENVRTFMVGIDIGGEELLMAHILNEKGAGIDLAMSHHPSGKAMVGLYKVMHVQDSILQHFGLDSDATSSLMSERRGEVARRCSAGNHERNVDMARLLNIPLMCVHTPADNHVAHFLKKLFDKKKPKAVRDVLRILKGIPEYQDGMRKGAGPQLICGKEKSAAGKIFVDMTGGTEGSKRVFARLAQAGVRTIVTMHLSEEHFKTAKSEFINVIVAGHIASDTLGLNLLLDELLKREDFNIIPCSGYVRVNR